MHQNFLFYTEIKMFSEEGAVPGPFPFLSLQVPPPCLQILATPLLYASLKKRHDWSTVSLYLSVGE